MSQERVDYQRKTEDAMFSNNIRSDLMDEEDLADLLADQRTSQFSLEALKNLKPGQTISATFDDILTEVPESNVMDIDEVKDQFRSMTTEIAEVVREALVLASSGKNLQTDATWKPILTYDRAGQCPSCGGYFPLNKISNNRSLLKIVTSEFNKLKQNLPTSWNQKNRQLRLFVQEQDERLGPNQSKNLKKKTTEDGELFRPKQFKVDWGLFRDALSASGLKFEQAKGPMKRKEMILLYESDKEWGKLAAGLILCDRRTLRCPHKGCHKDLWNLSMESDRPFHKISFEATRVILEATIGSPTARAPLAVNGRKSDGRLKLRMGAMAEDKSRASRKLIAEALLTATSVLGDITISNNNSNLGDVTISQEDSEKSSKIYTTPNHNIISAITKVLQKIRPIEAFIRDDRSVDEHHKWATSTAGQVLHAIHQSGCLFMIEKTGSWTYRSGATGNHATNLVRLNSDIQNKVVRDFVSTMADGETSYNSLEYMLSKETTPPMVCPPLNRSHENPKEGGFITRSARRKYPLVTEAPQYKAASNLDRFIPSEDAVAAVNNLQSTEWSVDTSMVEIARGTIKNHVRANILEKLVIRKAWQVRRHYFSEDDGSPILRKDGEFKTNLVKDKEFDNEKEALEYVNSSEASSSTCTSEKSARIKYKVWNEQVHEVYYIDFLDAKPAVTFGQVASWLNTFEFVKRLETNYPDKKFWHPWHFDWRGRIMPVSTMLSPQNDDFARGIITFATSHELTEDGRKWMGRVVASMYRDQPIPTCFEGSEKDSLEELIHKLDARTYECFDEVSSNELFHKMMRVIAENPEQNFNSWGDGDVFRAKAQGLQRLALTREFVSVLDQGENAVSRLPINLDASSSIYQHASALMRDSDMAAKVNVLPNETGYPMDVYREVVECLRGMWQGNPFSTFEVNRTYKGHDGKSKTVTHIAEGLDDSTAEKLKHKVLKRKMAKKPVMTIGYGASPQSMVRALLSDNNEENGKTGSWVYYHLGEGNWPNVIDDIEGFEQREYRRLITAHPGSVIGQICTKLQIPDHFHNLIAQKVISGYTKAIEEVLPGYKTMKKSLQKICDLFLENNDDSTVRLQWEVADGCRISNVYFKEPKMDSIGAWGGMDKATMALRTHISKKLPEDSKHLIPHENLDPVNFDNLAELIDDKLIEKLKTHEVNRLSNIENTITEAEIVSSAINLEIPSVDWKQLAEELGVGNCVEDIINYEASKDEPGLAKVVKSVRDYSGNFNVYFSRHIFSEENDHLASKRGIAPNFIHSLDACHMRMVVNDMAISEGVTDFWSVHDAFGCHPNHIEALRRAVNSKFVQVHKSDENGNAILARLYLQQSGEELPIGNMVIEDVMKELDGELLSKYLIS
tara:strand:- start:1618 stop:5709 length:4092 start_codon:yes stop_codon:yes gene_type:complete